MSTDTATSQPESVPPRGWRPRPRWWLSGLVLMAVGVAVLAWVWRHSDQSFDGEYGIKVDQPVGESVWTSLVHPGAPGAEQVTIKDLEPRITTDGAKVEIEYLICELDPDALTQDGVGGFGYGLHDRDVNRYCTSTRSAEGATFSLRSQPPQELILGVTATRPGRTVIHSHSMSFAVGWQLGSEELTVETTLVSHPVS